jgi:effector-binding domain-containing protein
MPRYQVSRSVHIEATPQRIYDVVADFGTWTTWSPWLIAEPDAKVTVSSPSASVGSTYAWSGEITGQGELEHKRLTSGALVEDEIRFLKPFKSTARVDFQMKPEDQGTRLTWNMDGKLPWFLFWMVPMMKTFIGMDYQRGLNMIRDWIETGSIPSKTVVHGSERVGPFRMAGIASQCSVESIGPSMEKAFAQAKTELQRVGLPLDGPPISAYTRFQMGKGIVEYISGFMIPETAQVDPSSPLRVWTFPGGQAFRVEHIGSYRHLGNAWSVANQIVRCRKMKQQRCATFEIYRTTPPETAEAELRTDIYLPLKT